MLKTAVVVIFAVAGVICSTGCGPDSSAGRVSSGTGGDALGAYMPSEVHIVGLTEITPVSAGPWQGKLNAYVDLVDSFGCCVKSPGLFRFELYEFVPRSSQPKGKRIFFPQDIDLTDATENNKHWRDFLRAYQFELPLNFSPKPDESFVLEVTFTTPQGNRLRDTFHIRYESQ
ncbi:MAG: hypothetical protein DRP65_12575 [Planctomycetota bacterium]|nr:MAG: hypothetical protein DRP65_12575 [Planctomycetota bacterium]